MFNQQEIVSKWNELKGSVSHLFDRTHREPSNDGEQSQPDGVKDRTPSPDEKIADTKSVQNEVLENQTASLQDKTYSFDEEVTDADYDLEDSLDFEDDDGDLRV